MGLSTADTLDHPGPPPRFEVRRCEHERLRAVWRVFAGKDKTKRYGFQCLSCGASGYKCASGAFISQWVGEKKCFDYMGYQPHEAVPYADETTLVMRQRVADFFASVRCAEARAARREAWWDWYDDYLHSGAWRAKRQQVLDRDGNACVRCGQPAHAVHHLSYANVGFEPLEDLVAICAPCHEGIHNGTLDA